MSGKTMRLSGLILLSGLLWASGARAQYVPSPQHLAVELKFGPYVPHLDNASWLQKYEKTPFSDRFGDQADVKGAVPTRGLLSQVEVDYQFFHKFGVLGIGLESGYYSNSAPSFVIVSDSKGVSTNKPCQVNYGPVRTYTSTDPVRGNLDYYKDCISGDSDTLNVVPIALMLVYRFDVLSKRLRVPIIPYMKVGFAYYVWWFGTSNSFTAQYTPPATKEEPMPASRSAVGGSAGVVLRPGLAIDLSAIDAHAARISDQEIGLNRIAAFVELNAVLVDGFGADHVMNLSDTSFSAGLSFEF